MFESIYKCRTCGHKATESRLRRGERRKDPEGLRLCPACRSTHITDITYLLCLCGKEATQGNQCYDCLTETELQSEKRAALMTHVC